MAVRQQRLNDDDLRVQSTIYVEQLTKHDPRAVRAACDEWATTRKGWPELSDLLDLVREHQDLLDLRDRPRVEEAGGGAGVCARIVAMFGPAVLATLPYDMTAPIIQRNNAGRLTDDELRWAVSEIQAGRRPVFADRAPPSPAFWRKADALAMDLATSNNHRLGMPLRTMFCRIYQVMCERAGRQAPWLIEREDAQV